MSVQVSHAYRKIDITRDRMRRVFYLRVMLRSLQTVSDLTMQLWLDDSAEHFGLGTFFIKSVSRYMDVSGHVVGIVCHEYRLLSTDFQSIVLRSSFYSAH